MKIETIQLKGYDITVLEVSREQALNLAQELLKQVNGAFTNGFEFKIEDRHYFKVAVNRVQNHIKEAIKHLTNCLDRLPEHLRESIICDLAAGDEKSIWDRYNQVKLMGF